MQRGTDDGLVDLRVLATSDVHGWLADWDYHAARPLGGGLVRLAPLIEALRTPNTILLDNGDFLQGSPLADHVADHRQNPVIAAMNHLRYDAATLGNHEFNFGLDALQQALSGAAFPVVSTNVSRIDGSPLIARSVVLRRRVTDRAGLVHDLRIGIVGVLPVQVMIWDRPHLEGRVQVQTIVAAARQELSSLRAQADVVIALCHAGIGPADAPPDSEDAATALAGVEGIDAVVAGHSHLVFPSPRFEGVAGVDATRGLLQGKPAVMPGSRASHLGVMDLRLRVGDWSVVAADCAATPAGEGRSEPLQAAIAAPHAATCARMEQPVGHTDTPINSFFAMVAPSRAAFLMAEASARHVRAKFGHGLRVLGTGQPFKFGGRGGASYYTDIPAGPLTLRHAADLYGYPNTIAALRLTGEEIALWLERAAGAFRRIEPGTREQLLLAPQVPPYNFDLIHGLSFVIDLSRPAMFDPAGARVSDGRISGLMLDGRPLDPTEEFLIATSSYRAGGSGGFAPRPPEWTDDTRVTDLIADLLTEGAPPVPAFWGFAPMPGTSVTFPTSPRAAAHLAEVPHLALTPMGMTEAGFLNMRLDL